MSISEPRRKQRPVFTFLITIVGLAFLAALGVALVPIWSVDQRQTLARSQSAPLGLVGPSQASTETQAQFQEFERPDLLRTASSFEYTAPDIPFARSHRFTSEGPSQLFGRGAYDWVSYAPNLPAGPRPLVLLFPGSNRPAMSMIDMWHETARREGVVLAAVDSQPERDAAVTQDAAFILDVLAAAQDRYDIDPDRIYLFGHSAGAKLAQVVVNRIEGPWRAAAVHAGTVPPQWLRPIENGAPVRHYLGSSDHIFDVPTGRAVGQEMARMGHDHELIIIPGHTHWFYVAGPQIAQDAWDWFDGLDSL